VTVTLSLPRFVIAKPLAGGNVGFYFNVPTYFRKLGCLIPNEPLGTDYARACGSDGKGGRAAALNALFDEWRKARNGEPIKGLVRFGSVSWLFREFKASEAYARRVSARTRPDYERLMQLVEKQVTKKGDKIGDRPVKAVTPRAADRLYARIIEGPRGPRLRQGEKVIVLCRHAWNVVHRLYPDQFNPDVPNPWIGVTKQQRTMATKPAATRDQVYTFAWGAIEAGHPEAAAAAVICFEWLQRPENVLAGYVTWSSYRSKEHPNAIKILHHKTGAVVWHPLEEATDDGTVKFYEEAEAVLAKTPRHGVPVVLKPARVKKPAEPYTAPLMWKIVAKLRDELDLPSTFTLDACRHGGMTELEEAELTDGQGRALSGHRSKAYEGYAKRTMKRALAATRKRYAHKLAANASGTEFQNGTRNELQNDGGNDESAIA
jgi:hypothetical protein